jgi:hypothetical protein
MAVVLLYGVLGSTVCLEHEKVFGKGGEDVHGMGSTKYRFFFGTHEASVLGVKARRMRKYRRSMGEVPDTI